MNNNKTHKTLLVVSIIFIIAGLLIAVVGYATLGFNYKNFEPEFGYVNYETHKEDIETTELTELNIEIDNLPVNITPSKDDKIHVTYSDSDIDNVTFTHNGNDIKIIRKSTSSFLNIFNARESLTCHISIPNNFELPLNMKTQNSVFNFYSKDSQTKMKFSDNLDFTVSNTIFNIANVECKNLDIDIHNGLLAINNVNCNGHNLDSMNADIEENKLTCNHIYTSKIMNCNMDINNLVADTIYIDVSNAISNINIDGNKNDYDILSDMSNGSINISQQRPDEATKLINVKGSNCSVDISFN